jgi:hypothetical protein
MGPILDMVVVSRDVEGALCEELGWRVYSCLPHPFTVFVRAHHFASSVVTPHGYKAGIRPPTRTYVLSHDLPSSHRLLPYG